MKNLYNIFSSAILSGIAISISCVSYLKLGGIAGAILFSFGLLVVIHYGWKLYTGVSGFIRKWNELSRLTLILIGNIIGCIMSAFVMKYSQPDLMLNAVDVVNIRMGLGLLPCLLMGIGCGFIMTSAVKFGVGEQFLPLLFGVPIFIVCGFLHSIADAFYIAMLPMHILKDCFNEILLIYLMVVLGNFIGCNLTRIIMFTKNS